MEEQQVDLEVVGRHALLFDDDPTSAFINSSDALVPWSGGGDPSLLIDRYDARHLLQRLLPPRSLRKQQQQEEDDEVEPDGLSRAVLDLERYRDLEGGGGGGDEEAEEGKKNREVEKSGSYHTVPFSYDASGDLKCNDVGSRHSGYQPPFPVPEYLLSKLPPTEKVHQIISRTAKFVSEHGGQSEIILRVKQGGNPTFGFLMPDHELHAYFRFLVDHPELSKVVTDSADKQEGNKKSTSAENELHVPGGALSLLGSVYGSGEDDGVQDTSEFLETCGRKPVDVTCAALSSRSRAPSSSNEEAKVVMKLPMAATGKPLAAKKSRSSGANTAGVAKSKIKDASDKSDNLFTTRPEANTSDHGALIVEPPSSLKRMVDKTVEFILKNGKEFEASLIGQDKKNEKFPFLRPSSQYHSYYLKVLQDTCESKLPHKNLSDDRNHSVRHVRSMTEVRGMVSEESLSDGKNMMNQLDGSYQLDRKEKFRMVIGGAKKDASCSSSKPAKPAGLSAEEAAAIVMAATRGLSSQTTSDMLPTSAHHPDTAPKVIDGRQSSSLGGFSSFPSYNPVSKTASDGKTGSSLPDGFSNGTGRPGKEICNTTGGVLVANAIAKSVEGEADSSDACLTKEQKLKAERLKRAKMFAAMIKSGKHKTSELLPATVAHGGSQVSSVFSGRESDLAGRDREGNSVPGDAEISDSGEKSHEKASVYDSKRESSPRKDVSGSQYNAEDLEGEHNHSRKRHHSRHSSRSGKDGRKNKRHTSYRRKHYNSSEDEHLQSSRDKHRRKHHSSSKHKHQDSEADETLNRKRSKSRHRRERHSSSDDESQERKGSQKHHKKSDKEESQNLENNGDSSTQNLSKQVSLSLSNDIQQVAEPSVLEAPSSVATEVPDDLRAKIRAMLLETM